ncbi:hypothetical protein UA08_01785 [Talaromyces atroroseus]|uniref:N-acetylglucosamine-induced protein 1 n=1 Tax=Talaromyces atroroseus TaxID=1441469 RepID=A0A1Q5QAL1_TALAT|nr:hypothetical protein UA08_01785 [Talaromyces atroroseus]OKL62987.1 hypothetical protein UA08_01785 [Talaromyces atroroseus]
MGSIQQTAAPFNLTEVDRLVLAQTDEEFVHHDWEDLKAIIARNDLGALRRTPSDLKRYIVWTNDTKATYGSITNYICQKRLKWSSPDPSSSSSSSPSATSLSLSGSNSPAAPQLPEIPYRNATPFADPSDYRVLRNDWPYGLTPDITHVVVWSKTPIATKPENGDVTDESRAFIEGFVDRTFVQRLQKEPGFEQMNKDAIRREHVLWFKNWTALQSVRSLEHFHILLRGVPSAIITEWTHESDVVR